VTVKITYIPEGGQEPVYNLFLPLVYIND